MATSAQKRFYEKNRERRIAEAKARKIKARKFIFDYKLTKACEKCNENHPACLDFHHIKDKVMEVADMVKGGYSIENIKKEILKCNILCANCHRKEHYGHLAEIA